MKNKLWILPVMGALLAGVVLSTCRTNLLAGPAPGESKENAPLALKGTALMDHPEIVEGVDGNPGNMIDPRQYAQIKGYFLKQIEATPAKRDKLWKVNFASRAAYASSVEPRRQDLRRMLGLVNLSPQKPRVKVLTESPELRIEDVTIALEGSFGVRALLFVPKSRKPEPAIIAVPDAEQGPEDFAGIRKGLNTAPWLSGLLGRGITVAIPEMVERKSDHPLCQSAGGNNRRRILWRLGFLVGRTLVGVEVQQVVALEKYLAAQPGIDARRIGVWGVRQGGMTALYAAAVDEHLAAATALDYFQQREDCWKEPVDRMIYGQLNEFGDAEIAALVAPRPLTIVTRWGGPVSFQRVSGELVRARRFYQGLGATGKLMAFEEASGAEEASAEAMASALGADRNGKIPVIAFRVSQEQILAERNEHFEGLYRYLRGLCAVSGKVRKAYWKLDSTPPQDREQKAAKLRRGLARLVGVIPDSNIPLNPRTLLVAETDKFLAYEVLLDVVPGVEAYGQLLVPRAVAGRVEQRLPAMICQHGFGGAPKYVSGVGSDLETNEHFYHRFGERLAERGYVVFAPYLTVPNDPRSPYWIKRADLINPLVREAAAVGMMRTGIELAKLHRIVDFLQSLPFVDGKRIGYYGLSYGGYSALWMPALEPRLKFTIISAYFNDRRKMLTQEDPSRNHSNYWSLPDTDFYNWDLLNRFTDLEHIAAMWPRPVAIEWGLSDPVTTPAWHQAAWATVEKWADVWGMRDKVISDDFIGPHTIHGIGTFFFIDRWLRPERSAGRDYGCDDDDYCNRDVAPDHQGYAPTSEIPYVTHNVDSSKQSTIIGRFYVSNVSPEMDGIALKLSRVGNPGDLVVDLGTEQGERNLGELRLDAKGVSPRYGLWYNLRLKRPIRLDPRKLYWFEVKALAGAAPTAAYTVYGPKPLGGEDYPHNFGLSFRILTNRSR